MICRVSLIITDSDTPHPHGFSFVWTIIYDDRDMLRNIAFSKFSGIHSCIAVITPRPPHTYLPQIAILQFDASILRDSPAFFKNTAVS